MILSTRGHRFSISISRWCFWIRFFGYGPWLAIDDGEPPSFNERAGHRRVYRFAGLKFQWLRASQVSTRTKEKS